MSAAHVRDLRATYAGRSGDVGVTALGNDLLVASQEFGALWERARSPYAERTARPSCTQSSEP